MKNWKKILSKKLSKILVGISLLIFFIFGGSFIYTSFITEDDEVIRTNLEEKIIDLRKGLYYKNWYTELTADERHKRCKEITLKSTHATDNIYVPFKTKEEWESFLANPGDRLIIEDCCSVFGDSFGNRTKFCP